METVSSIAYLQAAAHNGGTSNLRSVEDTAFTTGALQLKRICGLGTGEKTTSRSTTAKNPSPHVRGLPALSGHGRPRAGGKKCLYLQDSLAFIRCLWGVYVDDNTWYEPSRLCTNHPLLLVTTVQGWMMWSAVYACCLVRCASLDAPPPDVPTTLFATALFRPACMETAARWHSQFPHPRGNMRMFERKLWVRDRIASLTRQRDLIASLTRQNGGWYKLIPLNLPPPPPSAKEQNDQTWTGGTHSHADGNTSVGGGTCTTSGWGSGRCHLWHQPST